MIKLKIISLFKLRNILFIFLFVYVAIVTFGIRYYSNYSNENEIYGKIIDYKIKEDKVVIVIKGKEKIIANYYYNKSDKIDLNYGDYIRAKGILKKPSKNTLKNGFNYKKYLYNHKIFYNFTIESYSIIKNNNIVYGFKNLIYKRANTLKSSKYINALLLGNKSLLDESQIDAIKSNGIMHLFAVSGMHVSFMIFFLNKILMKFNRYLRSLFIVAFIAFYAFVVGFPASILRVFLCYVIRLFLKLINYNISELRVLSISAFILLVFNPFYIFDLGFIYSYVLLFFLLYYKCNNYFKTGILTFLVSAPISIYNFYHLNILSLLVNIISIPLISFFIFPLTVLTMIFPIFDSFLILFFTYFMKFNLLMANIRIFDLSIAKPPIILLILYYYFLMTYKKKRHPLSLAIISVLFILNNYFNFNYMVYYLDVSQGDSSLIISPLNKTTIMIDTGGKVSFNGKSKNYYTGNIITFLRSMGINYINYLVLTHGDYDHMGEAITLVNNFKVEKVIFNCGPYNDLEEELIKALDKKKIKYYSCIKELNIDNNKLYFLQTKEYDNENDNSNVIYTELNGYNFMFMGDAGVEKEKDILEKYNISDIDVLKIGHHGSKTSSGKEFINEINPKYSIISVGKNNRYGHPNKEVLNNLNNSKVYRTDHDGSVMFKIKNNKLKIETCSP